MKMKYPLPNDNARCIGSNCDKKQDCARYLSIEVDAFTYRNKLTEIKMQMKALEYN